MQILDVSSESFGWAGSILGFPNAANRHFSGDNRDPMHVPGEAFEIVPLEQGDGDLLAEFLLASIFVEPGQAAPDRSILQAPELRRYIEGWGGSGDVGFKAMAERKPIGAAWLRFWSPEGRGYGWVDDRIPELSMAVDEGWRGRGVGTGLLEHLTMRFPSSISLSVSKANRAVRLYERFGFSIMADDGVTLTMLRKEN